MEETSIAHKVRELLKEKPFLEESIVLGVANLSQIAKQLNGEIKGSSFHAVHAALRRYAEQLVNERGRIEKKVVELLKKSKLSIESGLISIKLSSSLETNKVVTKLMARGADVSILKGSDVITIITTKEYEREFSNLTSIMEITKGLVGIIIKSPKHLYTIGFAAFITNLISREGINMIDFMSSYDNTIIIVTKEDSAKAYNTLVKYTE